MRLFIISLLFLTALHAEQNHTKNAKDDINILLNKEKDIDVYLGAGGYYQSQPYKNVDALKLPSPLLFFDNGYVYARWVRFGAYFIGQEGENFSWGFSLTIQPRTLGYKSTDTPLLAGMQERESSWEAGIAYSMKFNKVGYFELLALQDILQNSYGKLYRAEIGKKIKYGRFTLVPSLLAIYFDKQFNNYYYGVTQQEANSVLNRPAYEANGGMNYAAQLFINYDITDNWHLLANARYDHLAKTISQSPITSENYIFSGMLSAMYSFTLYRK